MTDKVQNAEYLKQDVSHDEANIHLPDIEGEDDIVETLANYFNRSKDEIESHSRRQDLVQVRDLIIFLLRKYGDMSYPAIGRLLGNRDHTTIIHSYQKTTDKISKQPELASELSSLIGKVKEIRERKLKIQNELIPGIISSSEIGFKRKSDEPVFKKITERDMKILELWREGLTLANIGKVAGVSRERVRQIVISTVKQMAVNESITKGIVMDSDTLVEEESKKRQRAKRGKVEHPDNEPIKEYRWSRYYTACKSCGTIAIPHVRKGLCEQCVGQYRGERREKIVELHQNKCDSCGKARHEAIALFGRDFYITKDRKVLCKECFSKYSGKVLGSYKNYVWSRHFEKCENCGTTTTPHAKKGLCENCSESLTLKQRAKIIEEHGNRCDKCGLSRSEALNEHGRDLCALRSGAVLCRNCFQKQNLTMARKNR